MKILTYIALCLLFCFTGLSQAQTGGGARSLLDAAISAIATEDGWKSDTLGQNARSIVTLFPSSPEFPTARLLLAGYLMETPGSNNYDEALVLTNATMAASPISWRTAWAAVDKASILGFKSDAGALQAAKDALPIIDSAHLDQETDGDFLRILQLTGGKRTDVKDSALVLIVVRLLEQGDGAQADTYISQIVDTAKRAKAQRLRDTTNR
jgi:hypothetical protein